MVTFARGIAGSLALGVLALSTGCQPLHQEPRADRVALPELGVSLVVAPATWSGWSSDDRADLGNSRCVDAQGRLGRYHVYTTRCTDEVRTSVNGDTQTFGRPPAHPTGEQRVERFTYPGGSVVLVSNVRKEFTNSYNVGTSEYAFVTPDHGRPFVIADLAYPANGIQADPRFHERVRTIRALGSGPAPEQPDLSKPAASLTGPAG